MTVLFLHTEPNVCDRCGDPTSAWVEHPRGACCCVSCWSKERKRPASVPNTPPPPRLKRSRPAAGYLEQFTDEEVPTPMVDSGGRG